jgi:hypothetical protein
LLHLLDTRPSDEFSPTKRTSYFRREAIQSGQSRYDFKNATLLAGATQRTTLDTFRSSPELPPIETTTANHGAKAMQTLAALYLQLLRRCFSSINLPCAFLLNWNGHLEKLMLLAYTTGRLY